MPYDEDVADGIRDLLAGQTGVAERKMFGGLAFLVGGHLAVAASSQGGLLVRVDPASSDELAATTGAEPMEMRGRPVQGWLRVDAEAVRTRGALAEWVGRGVTSVRSMSPKEP